MAHEAKSTRARRVVFGDDENGRSTIVSDGFTETRTVTDAWTLNHLWESTSVPGAVMAEDNNSGEILPPAEGFKFMMVSFSPDSEWDYEAGYADALAEGGMGDSFDAESSIPGIHATDTVDIGIVLSGELWAISETGETALRPGDTYVMRGNKHAWQNRGDVPAIAATLMVSARRDDTIA